MVAVQDIIDYLLTVEGVLDACEMDDRVSQEVLNIERSVKTRVNNGYKNVGYDIAMERGHRVCVFYDDTYIFGIRSVLKLMTTDGTIMGTSLRPEEIESYKGREDVIWISEDFVVFPEIIGEGEEAFVLFPSEIHDVEDNVPGTRNVIGTSPTTSSDSILKARFGKPMVNGIYTLVIAFDL